MKNNLIAMKLFLSPLLALGLAASVTYAQQTSAPAKISLTRLNRAPVSNEILNVHLPRPTRVTLSNGMRLLVLEDHRFPSISIEMEVDGAGALYDPAAKPGLAQMTALLMRQGTASKSSRELSEEIEKLGAQVSVSAIAGKPEASVSASGLKDNFDAWLAILADVVQHPSFPDSELGIAKQRQLAALKQQFSSPSFLASKYFRKAVYGDSPASVASATPESVASFTSAELKQWYDQRFAPQNAVIVVAGDITSAEAKTKIESAFQSWKKTELKVVLPEVPKAATSTKVVLVDRPSSVQTNLLLGNLCLERKSPDYVALVVTNGILGGGTSGRLFMKLREEKGYTYGAYSRVDAGRYTGMAVANSEVRSAVTEGALQEFLNEFHRLAEQPVPEDELKRRERSIVANFALSLESRPSLISYALVTERYGFPESYWDDYAKQVAGVTAADVQRVAAKYLTPSALQIVAVGDPSIKPILAKYGPVEEVNPNK